ncbi:hypothetical protein C8R41DRAFT_855971 [Lentinula lateritia]|uniref:Uncharacterized protein n=1 Tax=Lentinula lateritia TaxID=40482 RepID=A0ABQ8UZI7_9AGAR|nr:hypothetical protein C8R41DRAFT_855971 [Lentinula lateritia]
MNFFQHASLKVQRRCQFVFLDIHVCNPTSDVILICSMTIRMRHFQNFLSNTRQSEKDCTCDFSPVVPTFLS